MKKCKVCKEPFIPSYSTMQATCTSIDCIVSYAKLNKSKADRAEIADMRKRTRTASWYRAELQRVFNEYIRLRDRDKPCVSCGCDMRARKGDASHFYSVGAYPNLRYNEYNVHLACVSCNQHRGGNLHEYRIRLPERIGAEAFSQLQRERHGKLRLNIPDLEHKITYYRKLIKSLKYDNSKRDTL